MYGKEKIVAKYVKKCLRKIEEPKQQTKLLFGRELKIVQALEPDEIIWQNLAFSQEE